MPFLERLLVAHVDAGLIATGRTSRTRKAVIRRIDEIRKADASLGRYSENTLYQMYFEARGREESNAKLIFYKALLGASMKALPLDHRKNPRLRLNLAGDEALERLRRYNPMYSMYSVEQLRRVRSIWNFTP
jgi:hypothetical protein